jgi:hypothetical protein
VYLRRSDCILLSSYSWIAMKHYIERDGQLSTERLVRKWLRTDPTQSLHTGTEDDPGRHGPYAIDELTLASYTPIEPASGKAAAQAWLQLDWDFRTDPTGDASTLGQWWDDIVPDVGAVEAYSLWWGPTEATADHSATRCDDFLELLLVDSTRENLVVITATND